MLCGLDHNCPNGPDGTCCGEPETTPVTGVFVTGLSLICGMCDGAIEIESDDLDAERGALEAWAMFGECPHCEAGYDASGVTFSINKKEADT